MSGRIVLGPDDFPDESSERSVDPRRSAGSVPLSDRTPPVADQWLAAVPPAPVVVPPAAASFAGPPPWLPRASVGARFVGQLLDALIVFGLAFAVGILGVVLGLLGLLALLVLVLFPLFGVSLVAARTGHRNGQSWGQQLAGVRVVRQDGQPLGFATALLRNIARMVPLYWLWIFLNPERQGLHDLLVHTIVVPATVISPGPVAGPPVAAGSPLGGPPPGPQPLAGPPPR